MYTKIFAKVFSFFVAISVALLPTSSNIEAFTGRIIF